MLNPILPNDAVSNHSASRKPQYITSQTTDRSNTNASRENLPNVTLDDSINEQQLDYSSFYPPQKENKKSILKKSLYLKGIDTSRRNEHLHSKRGISYGMTEVHLVENWKNYNKQKTRCSCFSWL